jgi:hypothetical protein
MSKELYVMDHLDQVAVILMRDACGNPSACRLIERLSKAQGVTPAYCVSEIVGRLDALKYTAVYGAAIVSLVKTDYFPKDDYKIHFLFCEEEKGSKKLTPELVKNWPPKRTAEIQEVCIKLLLKLCPEGIDKVEWF